MYEPNCPRSLIGDDGAVTRMTMKSFFLYFFPPIMLFSVSSLLVLPLPVFLFFKILIGAVPRVPLLAPHISCSYAKSLIHVYAGL